MRKPKQSATEIKLQFGIKKALKYIWVFKCEHLMSQQLVHCQILEPNLLTVFIYLFCPVMQ